MLKIGLTGVGGLFILLFVYLFNLFFGPIVNLRAVGCGVWRSKSFGPHGKMESAYATKLARA